MYEALLKLAVLHVVPNVNPDGSHHGAPMALTVLACAILLQAAPWWTGLASPTNDSFAATIRAIHPFCDYEGKRTCMM